MALTPNSRSARLDQIIEQRKPAAEQLRHVADSLDATISSLDNLARLRRDLLSSLPNDETSANAKFMLASVLPEEKIELARDIAARVARLRGRFDRPTINAGVVGHARQGKSKLLQTASGLGDGAIPTSDGSHCTATRSLIAHVPGLKPEAEVTFYTADAFLSKVITPFYRWNGGSLGLTPPVHSLSDLAGRPPRPRAGVLSATEQDVYRQLLAYWDNFGEYKTLLGTPGSRRIRGSEIRRFLAHTGENGEEYHNFRAISSAVVRCEFPFAELGKLVLVDLPGLGHHNPNDGDLLSRTLATDVDFVLFVRCPEEMGAALEMRDTELYDLASRSVPELPLQKWSLFVVNQKRHATGGNTKQCEIYSRELAKSSIKTVEIRIVDCSNPEEVGKKILDFTLDYLADHISELDAHYSRSVLGEVQHFAKEVRMWLADLRGALGTPSSSPLSDEAIALHLKFNQVWDDIRVGLDALVHKLRSNSDKPNDAFVDLVKEIMGRCEIQPDGSPLPSLSEIEAKRAQLNGYLPALSFFQTQLRASISSALSNVDSGLEVFISSRKADVTRVLEEKGKLATSTDGRFHEHGEVFLREFAHSLREYGLQDGNPLLDAVERLAAAKLSYRGFIQHRIRPHLNRLTPDSIAKYVDDPIDSAPAMQTVLRGLYTITLGEIRSAVALVGSEPNAVAYALVEEFVDRVTWSPKVADAWYKFYAHECFNIWPEDFQALGDRSRLRIEWNNALDAIANDLASMADLVHH